MCHAHQPIGDGTDIVIKPAGPDNLEEEVDKQGIHTHNLEKSQSIPVVFYIDPPIKKAKSEQTPSAGGKHKCARGNFFDDGCDGRVESQSNDQPQETRY